MTLPALVVTVGDPRCIVVGPSGAGIAVEESVGEWHGRPGPSTPEQAAIAGGLAAKAIERAVELVRAGAAQGIVTGPIDKSALAAAGYTDPGHTEMLERLTGHPTAMMLAGPSLRVVLATTHIALREVPAAVTQAALVRAAQLTRRGLQEWFGIAEPRLALCALNPHGGDGGRFGDEDQRVLAPAAREAGMAGPFAADTVFVRAMRGEFDAVIAPYHDVGMTAIKVASFGEAVNVTLGLPFPRTSPDHGTALDIAGQGVADAGSMVLALRTAAEIAARLS